MTRSEIMRRLHDMVQQLESVPDDWFDEGIYPLHKVTFARGAPRGGGGIWRDGDEAITLVVGVERPEQP